MRTPLLGIFVAWLIPLSVSAASDNDYPFPTVSEVYSPFEATVVGTLPAVKADLPKDNPLTTDRITVFEDREVPEPFFYDEDMQYSYALQDDPAPLIFLIAGTGGKHSGGKNVGMAKAFYQAGFNVISISSPTYTNFIVSASTYSVPGHSLEDAKDLYRVMKLLRDRHADDAEFTEYHVAGYSLGGFNTAFVTYLDEQEKAFNFKRALLINPPVNLYNSISLLDRMSQNIPGGPDNFHQFFEELMQEVSRVYKASDTVDINEDFLFQAYKAVNPGNEELAALVGTSFRLSSSALVYTADVMNNFGFVVPSNVRITANTDQGRYMVMLSQLGFTDYFHGFFYPFFKANGYDMTKEEFYAFSSLNSIQDYLATAQKVHVMHNADDIILEPGEIDFFRKTFGDRAKIYPKGGHCGNMDHRDNVAHMIQVMTR